MTYTAWNLANGDSESNFETYELALEFVHNICRKCPCCNGEICEAVEAEWTVLTTEEFKGYFEEEE